MKAVILAGGKGTRARPYTEYFPKAMIPVQGKPLIGYVINYLSSFSFIDEIIVVADFAGLGAQIEHYFQNTRKSKKQKRIKFVQDSGSGTAGDLYHLAQKLKNNREFILWFVDNLCAIDLKKMSKFFKEKKSLACIAIRQYRKEQTGFAAVKDGIITKFIEKPRVKLPNPESTGIYILDTKILDEILRKIIAQKKSSTTKKKGHLNLSYDILQDLSKKGQVSAFNIGKKAWIDVESPTVLERNKDLVKKIIRQMAR